MSLTAVLRTADGDALSGWKVKSVRMATYSLPLCQRYTVSSSQPSAADDPVPLVSELLYTDKQVKARPSTCAAVLDANRQDPAFLVYTRQNLDGSDTLQDRPLNVRRNWRDSPLAAACRHVCLSANGSARCCTPEITPHQQQ